MKIAELKLKPYARLAALGALGVCGGATALYLLIAFYTRPVRLGATAGGIDQTHSVLTLISLAVPFALIIAAHFVYARVLLKYARE